MKGQNYLLSALDGIENDLCDKTYKTNISNWWTNLFSEILWNVRKWNVYNSNDGSHLQHVYGNKLILKLKFGK